MRKYTGTIVDDSHTMDAEVYLASEVDTLIAELRGALADIAFSNDMTLEVARAKAKRIYESTEN